jgi:uncharacterized membrane protein (DUF4010 family)
MQRGVTEHRRAAGFRTFSITGLLGGVIGALTMVTGPLVLGLGLLVFTGLFGAFEWLEAKSSEALSVTTAIAGVLTFALGAYAVLGDVQIAVGCAVALTAMLALREPLHQWIASLRQEEIRAALVLLAMTFLALPILPNHAVDPWGALNPAEIWLFAIMIAVISFAGYVAIRWWGERPGIIVAAIAGGLASSTATTLTLARLGRRETASAGLLAGGILLSGAVMMLRVGFVATLLGSPEIWRLLAALAPAVAVLLAAALILLRRRDSDQRPEMVLTSPLELGTALKFAAAIAAIMLAARLAQAWLGSPGVLAIAGLSGLADVDAVTVSMARMGGAQMAMQLAIQAIALAVAVNTLTKVLMAGVVGGIGIGIRTGAASLLALAAGGTALMLV